MPVRWSSGARERGAGVNLTCPRCGARVTLHCDERDDTPFARCTSTQACGAVWNEDGEQLTFEFVAVGEFNVNDLPR